MAGLSADRVRANVERVRAEIDAAAARAGRDPAGVELLAAVKYVDVEDVGVLLEAGLTVLGENRAQQLEAKHAAHPEARWHFIGQLQSRKVKTIVPLVELIHSVASDSALAPARAPRAAGAPRSSSRSTWRGRTARPASPRRRWATSSPAAPVGSSGSWACRRSPRTPRQSRPHFAALRELAAGHGLRHLSMGTSQDFAVAVEEGATIVRVGSVLFE